jgi:hypothetical protein
MNVGELLVTLGLKVDGKTFREGQSMLGSLRRTALGLGAVFGVKALGGAMLGFNMKVEDAKNSIAGVLALAKKTNFTDELGTANELYDKLRKKAAELPGTTAEYVDMLKMLAHPMARAGMTSDQMVETVTGGLTASRGLGENWQKTARDMREFINFGKMNAPDTFARLMFDDYDSDAGKKKLKAMTAQQRATMMAERVNSKQMRDLQEAQKNSLSGRLDKLKDTVQQFFGKMGEGLAKALGPALESVNKWLTDNEGAVRGAAETIGNVLVVAFEVLSAAVGWLLDHGDLVTAILIGIAGAFFFLGLQAMVAWLAVAWPVIAGAAAFAALVYMFIKIKKHLGTLPAILLTVAAAFAALWIAGFGPIGLIVAGIAALVAAIYHFRDELSAAWDSIKAKALDTWDGIKGIPIIGHVIRGAGWVNDKLGGVPGKIVKYGLPIYGQAMLAGDIHDSMTSGDGKEDSANVTNPYDMMQNIASQAATRPAAAGGASVASTVTNNLTFNGIADAADAADALTQTLNQINANTLRQTQNALSGNR